MKSITLVILASSYIMTIAFALPAANNVDAVGGDSAVPVSSLGGAVKAVEDETYSEFVRELGIKSADKSAHDLQAMQQAQPINAFAADFFAVPAPEATNNLDSKIAELNAQKDTLAAAPAPQ